MHPRMAAVVEPTCCIANINVNPVDMAFPGILPVLNKECVRKAIMAALILNCKVPEYMYFDRKN
jgi:aspartyl-tRNA(Asn)/glutamyl-tRNA(Gln) amidotransferase subunit B